MKVYLYTNELKHFKAGEEAVGYLNRPPVTPEGLHSVLVADSEIKERLLANRVLVQRHY